MNDSVASTSATRNQRRLLIALALAATYMVAEFIGGLLTGSLALLADAGHMLSDVFALAMSVAAIQIARLPPTPQRTYGYQRTEILAALGHGILLVCISVYIFVEAYGRARAPVEILGAPMFAIAVGGLVINIVGLLILRANHRYQRTGHGNNQSQHKKFFHRFVFLFNEWSSIAQSGAGSPFDCARAR